MSVSWPLELQKMCPPFPQQMIGLTSLMHKDDTRSAMWVEACCDKLWFTPGFQLCLSHSSSAAQCWPSHGQCLLPGRSEETAASAAMLQGTPRGTPAATGLPSKSPSAHLPPSLSSYAKQLISPISSQALFLIVHQWFLCCSPSLLLSLISAARKQRRCWDIYRKGGVYFRFYCCLISLLHSLTPALP